MQKQKGMSMAMSKTTFSTVSRLAGDLMLWANKAPGPRGHSSAYAAAQVRYPARQRVMITADLYALDQRDQAHQAAQPGRRPAAAAEEIHEHLGGRRMSFGHGPEDDPGDDEDDDVLAEDEAPEVISAMEATRRSMKNQAVMVPQMTPAVCLDERERVNQHGDEIQARQLLTGQFLSPSLFSPRGGFPRPLSRPDQLAIIVPSRVACRVVAKPTMLTDSKSRWGTSNNGSISHERLSELSKGWVGSVLLRPTSLRAHVLAALRRALCAARPPS
ncbi:hypothetical protein GGR56DRAFT_580174 [Xylariaceae sp. FL0804]|nr:hypothetical protein GGR56DRAFT_580174 [Xylariaceae sp. FL0804]